MSHTAAIGMHLPFRGSDLHRIGAADGGSVTSAPSRALFAQFSAGRVGVEIHRFITDFDAIGYECLVFAGCLRGRQVDGGRNVQHYGRLPVNPDGAPVAIGGRPGDATEARGARNDLAHNMPGSTAVSLMQSLEGPHADGK